MKRSICWVCESCCYYRYDYRPSHERSHVGLTTYPCPQPAHLCPSRALEVRGSTAPRDTTTCGDSALKFARQLGSSRAKSGVSPSSLPPLNPGIGGSRSRCSMWPSYMGNQIIVRGPLSQCIMRKSYELKLSTWSLYDRSLLLVLFFWRALIQQACLKIRE